MLHNHAQSIPRATQSSQTSPALSVDDLNHENPATQAGPYPRVGPTPKEGPVTRGRPAPTLSQGSNILPGSAQGIQSSQRPNLDGSYDRAAATLDTGLQRRTSNNYGHHRQTSVIHGLQHSRNPSFNSPVTSSPLSPESLHNASLRNAAAIRRGQSVGAGPGMGAGAGAGAVVESTPASNLTTTSGSSQQPNTLSPATYTNLASEASSEDNNRTITPRRANAPARPRRGPAQAHSTDQEPDLRTPGEFALYHLFHSFVIRADQKINQCLALPESAPTPVEQTCGPRSDPSFDQLISALGHIARQEPKPLIDSLMFWRQAKADTALALRKQLAQHRPQNSASGLPVALPRRHTEPVQVLTDTSQSQLGSQTSVANDENGPDELVQADRQATVSVYILCRVLIEIFEQSSLAEITPELASKLEDIVFTQLKQFEPHHITGSSIRVANWRIYGQVLGQMSRLDFANIVSRYINQLGTWQQEIATGSGTVTARDLETRIELLLLSMQHLQMKTGPQQINQTCDFLRDLASLFVDAHGPTIKQAYCMAFEWLLLQLAPEPDRFHTIARFREFSDMVNSRLGQMVGKLRHWSCALPVSTLLLCMSSPEVFTSQWLSMVTGLVTKLRDRATRTPAMRAVCQLSWTYVCRSTDPPVVKSRKLEDAVKLAIPPGKKPYVSTEASIAEALIQLTRVVASAFPDLCFRTIIFSLINSEAIQHTKDLRIEQLEPERLAMGIKAFLAIMSDMEKSPAGRARFPVFVVKIPLSEATPASPTPSRTQLVGELAPHWSKGPDSGSLLPVNTQALDETSRKHYFHFCEILGKITILCDQAFGSSAVFNEKFSTMTPKTPLVDAFSLNRRDDGLVLDQKQSYYDLLHVAIQALPRCLSDHIPLGTLINLLCTGSAHVQAHVALSAAKSLKAIARQGHAQAVATAYICFIFQYDSQYSTMSDEGRLGPAHIEATLTLYIELLQVWIEQVEQKAKVNLSEPQPLEMANLMSLVDETESFGLFFLCSQSRRVRTFAIRVLRLVLQFDEALGRHETSRVMRVLESTSTDILDIKNDTLSVAERTRLEKDRLRNGAQSMLIEISSSENTYDASLWFKAFPNLIRHLFEFCPSVVAVCRGRICDRLALMQPDVERLATGYTNGQDPRLLGRSAATPTDVFFDQWKLYLVVACVTLSSAGAQSQSQLADAAHARKTSKGPNSMQDRLRSARALFSAVIPMLGVGPDAIRNAVVIGLGSINPKLYRTLLESLQYAVITCNDEAKARIVSHQRTPSSPQRSQMTERMRTEVTHIYKLTASFLRHSDVLADDWVLNNLINYTRDLRIFLSDADVQADWRFVRLRYHYCGLVEELFENLVRSTECSRWMPFESRKSAFTLMEDWCGYPLEHAANARRDDELGDQFLTAAVEKEKSNLRIAALSAMAALCAGPVTVVTDTNTVLQFNLVRMLSWIDSVFDTPNDRIHQIGQRALKLLMLHNPDHSPIVDHAIQCCYGLKGSRALENYFGAVTDVMIEQPEFPVRLVKVLGAVIFSLGHENREIRIKSARLLRILDHRQQKRSNLQEFDISISDKTRAVYKAAQFEYSRRLANAHPELGFHLFSEFCLHFRKVGVDTQRSMVAAVLPWMQTLELLVDPSTGGPTAMSHMLLANMLEITVRYSNILQNEVQALWQALATGPYAGNVQLILDFIINLSLERKEQSFVEYTKQIVVHLSSTLAGSRVLEFFLLQLVPRSMTNEKKSPDVGVPDTSSLPYVADLTTLVPISHKHVSLSVGQISLIFLVDLLIPPVVLRKETAIKLIHAVFILWDHYTFAVQEQAREMLVHLIHVLVTTKVDEKASDPHKQVIEEVVQAIRSNDSRVVWAYEELAGKNDLSTQGNRVPPSMTFMTRQTVDIFRLAYDDFSSLWAKEALHWASVCPVRHLACRSLQIFRCVSVSLDSTMLADMLARLSNTIAEEHSDYQTFSLEILTTLKVMISSMDSKQLLRHPQLFWTTAACLDTIHEREYYESLAMLEQLVTHLDFSDPVVVDTVLKAKPTDWSGHFEGVQLMVYNGLKSSGCLTRSFNILHIMADLPDTELVGKPDRLLFNVLANMPRFLHDLDAGNLSPEVPKVATRLAAVAKAHGHHLITASLDQYAAQKYGESKSFLSDTMHAIQAAYFPQLDAQSLIFMIGLLTNQTGWFRLALMEVLRHLIPLVDMRNPALTCHGPDLIAPLLRLLQTDHCGEALAVMDHVMGVPCTPMDRHHLRMSMTAGPARTVRKQYERTQSLYGIPEVTGWSIPMPAFHSSLSRSNVHAVFYTCGAANSAVKQPADTRGIELHGDDDYGESYLPEQSRSDDMGSMETVTDSKMGDIVSSLDSLDDFFDETDSTTTPTATLSTEAPRYFQTTGDHHMTPYDERTATTHPKFSSRSSSSMSSQNGFAESRPPTSHRTQPSFSSSAFSNQSSFSSIDEISAPGPPLYTVSKTGQSSPPVTTEPPTRPGLHARSITSPANQYPATQPAVGTQVPSLATYSSFQFPVHDSFGVVEEPLPTLNSDNTLFPVLTPTTSNSAMRYNPPPSATEAPAGFMRRGMRRLTGGRSESAKEREKARLRGLSGSQGQVTSPVGQSPQVPRVPAEYLTSNPA